MAPAPDPRGCAIHPFILLLAGLVGGALWFVLFFLLAGLLRIAGAILKGFF
jgi:hypothetical protein